MMYSFVEAVGKCRAHKAAYPDSEWGKAHIVISDFNFDDESLDDCIAALRAGGADDERASGIPYEVERDATIALLEDLMEKGVEDPPDF